MCNNLIVLSIIQLGYGKQLNDCRPFSIMMNISELLFLIIHTRERYMAQLQR